MNLERKNTHIIIRFGQTELTNSDKASGGQNMRTKVEICGVDTSTLPVLKHEEMRQLFVALQNGQEEVREQLVMGNLRLAGSARAARHRPAAAQSCAASARQK